MPLLHSTQYRRRSRNSFEVTGFNVEDLVIDLFYWFEKNTKRKACLSEYATFCDVNYRNVVKHVNTRWLSLERAVGHSSPRFQQLCSVFSTPMMQVYLLFYQLALQTFVHFNMFLQREDPLLPVLCQQMDSFLSKLASKFLHLSSMKAANRHFSTLNYIVRENQHPDDCLFVGISTKTCGNCLKRVTSAGQWSMP